MSRGLRRLCAHLAATAAVVVTAGCAAHAGGGAVPRDLLPPSLRITGDLTYLQRVALPPRSESIVELRSAAAGDSVVIAESRVPLEGRQVPIRVALTVDRAKLVAGVSHTVRGGILVQGRLSWITAAVAIDPTLPAIDLGTLRLHPFEAEAFASVFRCGDEEVRIAPAEGGLRLTVGTETLRLHSVPAASGAKYEADGDPGTYFWSKGQRARLSVHGRVYPECDMDATATSGAHASNPLTGSEWIVEDIDGTGIIDGSHATLVFDREGRVAGSATCNRYHGRYELSGAGLTILSPATTMMACLPALMEQERRLLDLLQAVRRYEITDDGALILSTADGRTITARRS